MRPLGRFLVLPMAVTTAILIAVPAAASPAPVPAPEFPSGEYAVPSAMGYGKYVAEIAPGAAGCTFSTYAADGQPIDTASSFTKPLTATVNQQVATFRTEGCTPWIRTSRILN